jgi:tubulin--tyrosine ligase-like protein 12
MKPWNMARTIDTTVSGDLSAIIRLIETGPKICQKYIEYPALFQGRKFDLRYIVLVRSICPLDIFLTDVFWVWPKILMIFDESLCRLIDDDIQ